MEIDEALQKEVVQRLLQLIRFRNEYPAFNGEFKVLVSSEHEINLSWQKDEKICTLKIDLKNNKSVIEYIDDFSNLIIYKI